MADFKKTLANLKRGPADVVGIELESAEIRAVRMRQNNNEEISVVAAGILDPIELNPEEADLTAIVLPPKLKAKYASIAVPGNQALVKILSVPGQFDAAAEAKIVDNMGLEDPDQHRISYKMILEGQAKTESRLLTVALGEEEASLPSILMPSGTPAPFSIEIAGLATMTAFLNGPAAEYAESAVGAIHFGEEVSTFALFNKNVLALIRRFDVGMDSVLEKVQETLGVDRETAQGITTDGAFDISQSVSEVLEPVVKQMIVSRDFVERREDCSIANIFISGGLVSSRDSLDEMKSSLGTELSPWDPFASIDVQPDAIPEELKGQEWRFSAAIGAVLGTFEES